MEVKVHENKICRALCRGPMLYGLPLMQTFGVLLGGGLGFFIGKLLFGFIGAIFFLGLAGIVYMVLAFIATKDPMFISILFFHFSTKFYPRLTNYCPTRKVLEVKRS